jgi:hypothetical protein
MENLHWKTAISQVEPNKILLRGYAVVELMGRLSYGDAVYLTLRGELPPKNEGKMIEAILVSVIDHGAAPPSSLRSFLAAAPDAQR